MFKSAVDAWYYGLVVFLAVVVVACFVPVLMGETTGAGLAMLAFVALLLIALGLPLWLLFSTYYRVNESVVLIRSGPFSWSVPVAEIESVRPSRSLVSGPALSLRRLEIRYGNGKSVLVSPADQEGFLRAVGH